MKIQPHVIQKISGAIIIIAIILVAFAGGVAWYRNSKWDPLAEYPIQIVSNPDDDSSHLVTENDNAYSQSPVFYWDEDIHSSGVKCVKAEEGIVAITGILYWVADEPPGRLIEAGRGANERGPGCQVYQFSNPIPERIREEMQKMKDDGLEYSIWHLTGTETPIRNGEEGEPRTWQTTTFKVIHKDKPS